MKLTFKINKSVDFVLSYLTDMQKFVLIHPAISKINLTSNNNYLVFETLKLGFISFSFTYPITIHFDLSKKIIIYKATVMNLTKIEMKFIITSENELSVVEETLQFNSILPIKGILQKIFKKQHEQLFRNIELLDF